MATEIITKDDLQLFRIQLLHDLQQVLMQQAQPRMKNWLKSTEVRKLLNISAGTLQNLRLTGKLAFRKVGGILYYSNEEVQRLFEPKDD